MADEEESTNRKDSEFLAKARKHFEDDVSDEQKIREQANLDLGFVAGTGQWDEKVRTERNNAGRPALTFNRMHTFVQQVSNEARQNKPQIKFVVGDGGDKDTAEVKEGIARHIQYNSDAQVAYETAVEYSAGGSFGFIGLTTDYCDDEGWDQDLKIRSFLDPFAVYGILIPTCFGVEPQHAFVIEEVPIDDYKRQYDIKELDEFGWEQAGQLSDGWIGTDTVRVAEYWWIEYETKTLKRKKGKESREVQKPHVYSCKLNGFQVMKDTKTEWVDKCIPIWAVLGKQIILDGKPNLFSVVRFQRDPQQLINFYKTRIAETMASAPIQPYIVYEGQTQNHESEWTQMAIAMRPYITIAPVLGPNGQLLPPPQRQVFEAPIQSLSNAAAQEIDDMKATTGIYDASLGNKSNESSGIALQRRQQQSNITNMHFMDNLERTFKQLGTSVARCIPKIYDSKRVVQMLGADETPKVAKINWQHIDESGQVKHYKVKDSSQDIPVVTIGRTFNSKRMESFDMMTSVLQTSPNLLPMIGDIFFANSDLAGADLLAKRFKKMLPPNLQDDDQKDPAAQVQALQTQLQQAHQVIQVGHQHIQQLEQEKQAKTAEVQGKVQIAQMQEMSRQEIVKMQEATKIAVAQINASKDAHQTYADAEMKAYDLLHSSAHEAAMQGQDQAYQAGMAQQQQEHAQQMAEQGHQQALEQGDAAAANQAAVAQAQPQQESAGPAQG